jgi:hypothetical protein
VLFWLTYTVSLRLQAMDAGLGINSRAAPIPHAGSTSSRDNEECLDVARRGPPKLLGGWRPAGQRWTTGAPRKAGGQRSELLGRPDEPAPVSAGARGAQRAELGTRARVGVRGSSSVDLVVQERRLLAPALPLPLLRRCSPRCPMVNERGWSWGKGRERIESG